MNAERIANMEKRKQELAARGKQGRPVKTAKVRINAAAATKGWTIRDDGGPGKVTDYFWHKPVGFRFIRVYYDMFGRIISVRDAQGRHLVKGRRKEAQVIDMMTPPFP